MRIKTVIENVLRNYPPLFRFSSNVYHKINGSFRTLSPGTSEAIAKAYELVKKDSASKVGDYYEFGLFRGYTFLQAYKHAEEMGLEDIHFYGFDSFSGLPIAEGIDAKDGRFFEGQFACSKVDVEKNLAEHGMDIARMTLTEGYYEDSLTESLRQHHAFKKASVVLLDCDYYSSTKEALDWMIPYLQVGTVLLFDDWFSYGDDNELGQQKAFKEFLDVQTQYHAEPLWDFIHNGKGFILRSGVN